MQPNYITYASAMQLAFVNAFKPDDNSKLVRRVGRVIGRQRLRSEPGCNARVSFRTAQKLKAEGVL